MSAVSAPGIGIREFARRDGCDDKLVRRAIGSGRLTTLPDGTLDPALVGGAWRKANRRDTTSANGKETAAAAGDPTQPRPIKILAQAPPDGELDLDGFVSRLLSGQFASLADAERIKENALALKHVLAVQREAGSVIEIELAETVVFDTFRAARDAWLNWPVRVGALIAADLGVDADRATEILTAHVHQHLAELGEPPADFAAKQD